MNVLRFVPILGRKARRAVRAAAIEAAMQGAQERGFLTLPFAMTDAEIDSIRDRWKIAARLAHRNTAQIILDNDARIRYPPLPTVEETQAAIDAGKFGEDNVGIRIMKDDDGE